MTAYYNEIDPFAAQWLRELIKAGHIAPGEVDERSIEDVIPSDLMGFTQCHFFAGIGVWSHALRQAGWEDSRKVWTGSCPCQPFSAAGKRIGLADERNLWPAFEWLIRQCRPDTIFGEQVESAIKHDWLDHVALSLEDCGYTVGAVGFPAASVGAPHKRQRLYWVAHSGFRPVQRDTGSVLAAQAQRGSQGKHDGDLPIGHSDGCPACVLAHSKRDGRRPDEQRGRPQAREVDGRDCPTRLLADAEADGRPRGMLRTAGRLPQNGASKNGNAGIVGDSGEQGLQEQRSIRQTSRVQVGAVQGKAIERTGAPTNGFWRNAEWIPCRDGKARPTEPGTFPLAHGAAARVGRLRGYGNAIVAPQAEAFIRAFMELNLIKQHQKVARQ